MKLVIIYGPPAVGKHTVAKHLAKLTGYTIFHNHLIVDLVASVLPFSNRNFWKITLPMRYHMIESLAKENVDTIATFVYGRGSLRPFRTIVRLVEKHKGKVLFVRLHCEHKELYKRVKHNSRKSHAKIQSVQQLKDVMKKEVLDETSPFGKHLVIDNTKLSAKKCAELIKKYYKL